MTHDITVILAAVMAALALALRVSDLLDSNVWRVRMTAEYEFWLGAFTVGLAGLIAAVALAVIL